MHVGYNNSVLLYGSKITYGKKKLYEHHGENYCN